MKNLIVFSWVALAACSVGAQGLESGRDAFLKRQAYAEMQRVSGQIDVLQASHDDLAERVKRIESGSGELGGVKADIAALKAEIAAVRREMNAMRQDIVNDITKKVTALIKANQPSGATTRPTPARPSPAGTKTYTVQSGDSLYLIAQAFSTSVAKLKELNGLKSDRLQIGQKLLVPKN